MSDDDTIRVQLARIEGKQDVTNERLETANKINDERHEGIKLRLAAFDDRLQIHGDRLGLLEARDNILVGERQGIGLAAKVLPFLGGSVAMAVLALIARAAGL